MITLLQSANLALRFLLELCALAAFGYWGFQSGTGLLAKLGLSIGAILAAAVAWGVLGSPRAAIPLSGLGHLLFELAFFGLAAAALVATRRPTLAAAFVLVFVLNRLLMALWGQ